jgi:hypothetical protein
VIRLREAEIDANREKRLIELKQALHERAESQEFLASQRLETLRQNRMVRMI